MNPVLAVQTDLIDGLHLLIPGKLLKAWECPNNPAYKLARPFSITYEQFCGFRGMVINDSERSVLAKLWHGCGS
jgi:hypothetical protein